MISSVLVENKFPRNASIFTVTKFVWCVLMAVMMTDVTRTVYENSLFQFLLCNV